MPVHQVVLSEHHEALISDLVDSGQFRDANEVVEEGLRLIEADRKIHADKEQKMREAVQAGLEDLNNGRSASLRDRAEIASHIRELGKKAAAKRRPGAD